MIELKQQTPLGNLVANQFGDKYLFPVNRKLFEQIDYQTRFKREYGDTFNSKDTLYIISGTDSGLLVKQLLKYPVPKGTTWLFIELPEIIEHIQTQYDLEDHEKVIVTTEEYWQEEAKKTGLEIYFMLNKVVHIKSFAAQYYYLNNYLILWQSIEAKISHLKWQYQSQLGSKIFIQRQLENLAENHTPAVSLKDYYKGKSAIILAGGPSLDQYIPWIEEHQEHYLIIAVSRIARRLLQTRIKPDIFVSVDPHISNFNVSKEIYNFEQDTLLVNQYHVSPQLLGNWLGKNVFMGQRLPWSSKLNTDNINGIGPTVTNSAILLAIQMGIKQQLLFGVDLCNSPEGFSHAKGSSEHESGPEVNIQGQTVITNSGKKAETNSAYFEAITTIAQLAELAEQMGGEVINPSPDSTRIDNVQHIICEQLTVPEEKTGISYFINAYLNHEYKAEHQIKHYREVLKELKQVEIKLDRIRNFAVKGLEYNNKFFADDNPSENFRYKLKMDKIEKELNSKNYTELTELSKKFGVNEFLYFLNTRSEEDWTDEEIKKSAETYYRALKSGSEKLNQHIFSSINLLECRLLENNQIDIIREHIHRHLNSFNKSSLLERKIINQKKNIERNFNQQSQEQRDADKRTLDILIKNKKNIISQCRKLLQQYNNKSPDLGDSHQERIQTLSFFILMLNNLENQQTRRLSVFARNNPGLCFISDDRKILGHSPKTYIQRQNNINDQFLPVQKYREKIYLYSQIKNLQENYLPAIELKKQLENKSVILLTDRQSLDENLFWIENNQNKYIIITIASLIKHIVQTSIKPDIIICGESDPDNFESIKLLFHYENDALLVHPNHILPTLTGNWLGLSYYMDKLFPWSYHDGSNIPGKIKKDKSLFENELNMTLSLTQQCKVHKQYIVIDNPSPVENMDLTDLCHFRTETIFITGQQEVQADNLNADNKPELINTYQTGNLKKQKIKHYNMLLTELFNRYDKITEIKKLIQKTIHTVEMALNNYGENDRKNEHIIFEIKELINHLKGQDYYKLTELCRKLCNQDPENLFDPLKTNYNKDYLISLYTELNWLHISAITLGKHLFTAINRVEVRLLEYAQLTITDDIIKRHFYQYQKTCLLDHLSLSQEQEVINEVKKRVGSLYQGINSSGKTKQERYLAISFLLLTEQYGHDIQNRRIYIHETENKELADFSNNGSILDVPTTELKNNFKKSFDFMFNMKNKNTLNGLEVKLYNLFINKDSELIANIIRGLILLDTPESAAILHLAKGYQYELSNDFNAAITEYGLADSPSTIESALKRLAHISLNQGEFEYTYNLLKVLSEISPDYLPQLAELLLITKNYQEALEIYSQYLEYNMSDVSVLIKIGKLYEDQNIKEGAQFIYRHILELEPENQAAVIGLQALTEH